jgi:uncharacterized membrane protein
MAATAIRPNHRNRRNHSLRLEAADKDHNPINVGRVERWVSGIVGGALALHGISRRSPGGMLLAALAGGLIYRGTTGHSRIYEMLKINTAGNDAYEARGTHVEMTVTIDRPPKDLYTYWRNFENLPRFMKHLKSVVVTGDRTSHWIAKGPAGKDVAWDAEIINERPNALIAWRSLEGADVEHAGSVRFESTADGHGTEMHVTLQYYPPAGVVGMAVATLFGEEPSLQIADDLRRFKRLMEDGESLFMDGQPYGVSTKRPMLNQNV